MGILCAVRGGAPEIGVHCLKIDARRDDVREEKAILANGPIGAHTANTITGDFPVELFPCLC